MMDQDYLKNEISRLQGQLAPLQEQLRQLEQTQQKVAVQRVAELTDEIEKKVVELTELADKYSVPFELNLNGSSYGDQLKYGHGYWNTSGMGC